jgi:hypothetical protein
MWQFGHSTQWRIRGTRDSPMATCSVKTTAVADGLRLILFRFYLGILSALATAPTARMTVSTRSSYQLLRKHSGSRRYSRDPCCPTPPQALRLRAAFGWNAGCGSSENTFYRSNRRGPYTQAIRRRMAETFCRPWPILRTRSPRTARFSLAHRTALSYMDCCLVRLPQRREPLLTRHIKSRLM